ncbi:uncharacterized protein LOC108707837 isoform X2 [Xenopus laevis]|uniref:Uncharacterized protein LOC108707837 isoform X2 n=1 Tax=Xenopus laevis TaxID=8355 RepID=A0A8J1M6Q6_XENLA|nr:uncharacterized protein LOC108707837 isoform X2 [Xenopus laevis]
MTCVLEGKRVESIMSLHWISLRREFPFQKVSVILLCLAHTAVSEPGVKCKFSGPAIIGGNATLRCQLPGSFEVLQVTWQRSKDGFRENIATYSNKYGVKVLSPFNSRVEVFNTSPKKSSMKISALTKEDEACYICAFSVYQHGAYTGQVCLPTLGNEFICSAVGSHILNITVNPPNINTDSAAQSEGGITGAIQKGTFTERENVTCTFQLPRTDRHKQDLTEQYNDLDDDEEIVSTNCSASGKTKPYIIWENEGKPVSTEYKEKVTGDITTVTSTRWYSLAWLLAQDKPIICYITINPGAIGERKESSTSQEENSQTLHQTSLDKETTNKQDSHYVRLAIVMVPFAFALLPVCFLNWKRKAWQAQKAQPVNEPRPESKSNTYGTPNTLCRTPTTTRILMTSTTGSEMSKRNNIIHNQDTNHISSTPGSASEGRNTKHNQDTENTWTPISAVSKARLDSKTDKENKTPKRKLQF